MKQTVPIIKYPLDLSGTNPNNLVIQEFHDIGPDTGRALAPNHGPFFTESLKVVERTTGRVLTPHDDYMVLQPYQSATQRTGKPVAAVIYVHNKAVDDEITIEYQVVGGEFSWSIFAIKQLIEDLSLDNRPVYWGDIIGRPIYFPPAPHLHPLSDTFGWEFIGYQLEEIARAILNGDVGAHEELMRIINLQFDEVRLRIDDLKGYTEDHVNDVSNPHAVTKAQTGLGLVQNYAISSKVQAEAGVINNAYMTPLRVKEAIDVLAMALFRPHLNDTSNPHQVTKAQVGLSVVGNFPVATKAEAEAGVATNRYMTPQRTAEAINTLAGALLRTHINDKGNPHGVTKAQVGLPLVENYAIATKVEAEGGVTVNKYMTPQRTKEAIDLQATALFRPHVTDVSNPHRVTKAQVGLSAVENFRLASRAEAEAGASNGFYMTPLRTNEAINVLAMALFRPHTNDKNNPHQVTKAQVGLSAVENLRLATKAEAETGASNGFYMTPLRTKEAIESQAMSVVRPHVANTSNPHGVTKAQVGLSAVVNLPLATTAEAVAGAVNTRYMTPLRTKEAINVLALALITPHTNDKANPHAVTKAQVGLSIVENLRLATKAEAEVGASNGFYMTPLRTKEAIESQAMSVVRPHVANTSNPHGVTKTQVGLSAVENFRLASRAEAEVGASNGFYMTPLRTKEAIDVLAMALFRPHLNDTSNPHQVTKAQVGLSLIQNYTALTAAQATALGGLPTTGIVESYMRSSDYVAATRQMVALSVTPHVNSRANPHAVTKAQVGLGNLPNAISNARTLNSADSLATSKAIFDHVASGDHDARYVRISQQVNTSIHWDGSRAFVFGGGAWRQIWPAQWS